MPTAITEEFPACRELLRQDAPRRRGQDPRKLTGIAEQVNSIEDDFVGMTDAELRAMADEFRERLSDGQSLDDILPEAFATVREAARRTLGQRHFDVQVMGGAALPSATSPR